jgi:ABC-type sugar transport system permease subunit
MSAADLSSGSVHVSARSRRALRWRPGERLGYAMVTPAILALLAITAFPLVYNLWNSFRNYNLYYPTAGKGLVGAKNYRDAFTQPGLVAALEHTMAYTAVSVTVEVALGLGIALLLNRPVRGRGVARTLILLPWALPTVVAATVWKTLLDPQTGGVDYVLRLLHLPGAHTTWLGIGTVTSWASILIVDCWQTVPFVAIILLAGLQGIPRDLYEAAEVDGASRWHVLKGITLPMLRPALLVVLVFRTLSAFMIFDVVYALTSGGPGTATQTVAFLDYNTLLVNTDFGLGGAISIVMVVVALAIAAFYWFVVKPEARA